MGKRAERKSRAAAAKQKQAAARAPKSVLQQSKPVESTDDGVPVMKERKPCPHLDKGIDSDKISVKIGSSDPIRCEDCREGVGDRRGKKGKGKHGKKKGSSLVDSKAIWVCLGCGHYACGGVGLPTTPQSHVVRHARQTRHPLVIQWENPHLRWCFPCNTLIPVEKTEENGENKDALSEVVKLIKGRSTEISSVDVEDAWFGSGNVNSEIKSESTVVSGSDLDGNACYVVRGLANLGNTCFFNSVMQNLLAMSQLQDYFLNAELTFGPLTIALKKLFAETKPETGLRNVINPRSFFGCICSKAPQFKGYQQHDSHELLRCLLDGLCSEELAFRKRNSPSEGNGISSNQGPVFVDYVFGGQIASTVRCVECGHSSTVYEPFLDLSLPVPTKKAPSKKTQPASRAKKTKLPPKKSGRIRSKGTKDTHAVTTQSISNLSISRKSQSLTESTAPLSENVVSSSGGSQLLDSVGSPTVATQCGSALQNVPADPLPQHDQVIDIPVEQTVASLDDFWLDYIEPKTTGDVLDSTWQKSDVSVIQDSTDFAWLDYIEPETISDEHGLTLQNNDVLFVQDSGEKNEVSDDSLINSNQIPLLDSKPNLQADSSSGDAGEDELPLVVQDSEVILLPYNEEISTTAEKISGEGEASSSVVGCRQEEVDFDGFGDLFNEPETAIGPVPRPSSGTESVGSGFVVGNSSDSDPDEVDDSDSPVSVESCLVHFIKPELLTDDNAWDCESCSKTLQRQKLEALKRRAKLASKPLINGGETSNQNDIQGSSLTDVDSLCNGDAKTNNDLNTFCESLVSQSGKTDCFNQDCAEVESGLTNDVNPAVPQREKGKMKINDAVEMQSRSLCLRDSCSQESITDQDEGSCSVDGATSSGYSAEKVYQSDSQLVAGNCESEESKVEEINSKIVKVKRDATKRVLINKAPPILTIHLKRFSQDARGRLSKLNGHVNFSEIINLRPYMDPGCTDHDNYDYRLVGVVEHLGTMRGGHYVAYVRGGPKNKVKAKKESVGGVWYHASDVYVREVSLEEVLRCEEFRDVYH
ncbi:ubiquitin carboxyl-terminal hydrolase 2 [Citrus sinensis]|nr:ubiquitin carboxyl-terminal hydrolase 2 [Citrus sinensis]